MKTRTVLVVPVKGVPEVRSVTSDTLQQIVGKVSRPFPYDEWAVYGAEAGAVDQGLADYNDTASQVIRFFVPEQWGAALFGTAVFVGSALNLDVPVKVIQIAAAFDPRTLVDSIGDGS